MPTPLTAARYGQEGSCFICEASNPHGLQIPFELSDDGATVSAKFTLGTEHSGVPPLVHGGLSLALLDEAQSWAVIAVAGKWGLIQTIGARFSGAVLVDHVNTVRATVTEQTDKLVRTEAVLLDAGEAEVVRSSATFSIVGDVNDPHPPLLLTDVPPEDGEGAND